MIYSDLFSSIFSNQLALPLFNRYRSGKAKTIQILVFLNIFTKNKSDGLGVVYLPVAVAVFGIKMVKPGFPGLGGFPGKLHEDAYGSPWLSHGMSKDYRSQDMCPLFPQKAAQYPIMHSPVSAAGDEGEDYLVIKKSFTVTIQQG